MAQSWNAGATLVLRAALLAALTGCGITGTKAPQPLGSNTASGGTPLSTSGLQLGYVWQGDSRNLYPILGVTGAAHYGSAALSEIPDIGVAAASPAGASALVLHTDGTLQVFDLATSSAVTLATGIASDSRIQFSPAGAAAVLVSPTTSSMQVVTGLPSKPQIASLSAGSTRQIAGAAVSDTGTVLAAVKQPGSSALQLGIVSATRGYAAISPLGAWGGAAFAASFSGSTTESAVVADNASAQLIRVGNISGTSPAVTAIATGGLLVKPSAVAVSPDGLWALVADTGKPQIVRVGLSAGVTPTAIACACTPSTMTPISPDGLFAVTAAAAGQPVWILDVRTTEPRAFFVPALPAVAKAAAAASNGAAR